MNMMHSSIGTSALAVETPTIPLLPIYQWTRKQGFSAVPCDPNFVNDKGKRGKAPSIGPKKPITWEQYKTQQPPLEKYEIWAKCVLGLGAVLSGEFIVIDIDFSHLDNEPEKRLRAITEMVAKLKSLCPKLAVTYIQKSGSGGVHIFVKVEGGEHLGTGNTGTYNLMWEGVKVGEIKKGFVVLAPSMHESGNRYEAVNGLCDIVTITLEEFKALGIVSFEEKQSKRSRSDRSRTTPVDDPQLYVVLERCLCPSIQEKLQGKNLDSNRRSENLHAVASEASGWEYFLKQNKIPFSGSAETITEQMADILGYSDSDAERKAAKALDEGEPAADEKGCWLRIRKLNRALFELRCPTSIKTEISSANEAYNGDQYQFDPEDLEDGISSLKAKEQQKAELKAACFDDESIHGRDFYLKGIFAEVENNVLRSSMRNRYPAIASAIDAFTLGLVPAKARFMHPLEQEKPQKPVMLNVIAGRSSDGKSAINSLIELTLGSVAFEIDMDRQNLQESLAEEFKPKIKKSEGEPEVSDKPSLNMALLKVPPKSQVSNATPQAVERIIAANQHYEKLSGYSNRDIFLPALAMCLTIPEGRKYINLWELLDPKRSYASTVCALSEGECKSTDRVTDSTYTAIKEGMCGLLMMIQHDNLLPVYRMERPTRQNPNAVCDGLSARYNVVMIEQTGEKKKNPKLANNNITFFAKEDERLTDLKRRLKQGFEALQYLLHESPYVTWERQAGELYLSEWLPWLEQMQEKHQGQLTNYWAKLDAALIRAAGSKACQRWISESRTSQPTSYSCGEIIPELIPFDDTFQPSKDHLTVTVEDAKVAIVQCKLYAATRLYYEVLLNESDEKIEALASENKSLKQESDILFRRFTVPSLTRLWIEEQRSKGVVTARDLERAVNSSSRKKLKERYGINVRSMIESVLDLENS